HSNRDQASLKPSRHLLQVRSRDRAADQEAPADCPPLDLLTGGGLKAPLFIGESSDQSQNVLQLPPGVAYHIEPMDYYRIEVHVVNASANDITANVEVYLLPAAPDAQVQYADMLFYNNA